MSKTTFQRIALTGRTTVSGVPETLLAVKEHLLSLNKEVVIEASAAEALQDHKLTVVSANDLNQYADLLIVVGGDGSLLTSAHIAVPQQLPVLGINRGRLGFLTDIPPDHLTKIDAILNGHYKKEDRFLLDAVAKQENATLAHDVALNDVVLLPGDVAKMIEFYIYINGEFVCSQRADGLIMATPTGSTAYALSGGGPILHPQLDAIAIVPMFPHTLSSRPIVVKGDSKIKIIVGYDNEVSPYVSCDGQKRVEVPPSSTINVHKSKQTLHLIHPEEYNYYEILQRKLNWERGAVRKV